MSPWRKGIVVVGVIMAQALPAAASVADADCRECHFDANGAPGAEDYSAYYTRTRAHHPVGVPYPVMTAAALGFAAPSGPTDELWFFDSNADGVGGEDEIRLYGASAPTIECASCHRAHGEASGVIAGPPAWLRIDNEGSRLCVVCHRR